MDASSPVPSSLKGQSLGSRGPDNHQDGGFPARGGSIHPVLLSHLGYNRLLPLLAPGGGRVNIGVARGPRAGCLSPASEPPYHRLPPAACLSAVPAPRWRERPPGLCVGRAGSGFLLCAVRPGSSRAELEETWEGPRGRWSGEHCPILIAEKRCLESIAQAMRVLKRSRAPSRRVGSRGRGALKRWQKSGQLVPMVWFNSEVSLQGLGPTGFWNPLGSL